MGSNSLYIYIYRYTNQAVSNFNCGSVVNTFRSQHFTNNLQQQKFQGTNSAESLNTKQLTRNMHKELLSISTY